jgi:hypothetical protein
MAFLRSSLLYKTRARRGSPGGCRKSKNLLKMTAYGKQLRQWEKEYPQLRAHGASAWNWQEG